MTSSFWKELYESAIEQKGERTSSEIIRYHDRSRPVTIHCCWPRGNWRLGHVHTAHARMGRDINRIELKPARLRRN
jgi:hypothetical protein